MINNGSLSEWMTFYYDEAENLQRHFDAGGTFDMLNGCQGSSAMYNCCNEDAVTCLPIMMKYGAKPDCETWDIAIRVNRVDFVEVFLRHGYFPPKQMVLEHWGKPYSIVPIEELTRFLCLKSVIYILCISKSQSQPLCHVWKKIAKVLWGTRFEKCWIELL